MHAHPYLLTVYHLVAVQRLDGMQIRRNQSWDGFPRYLLACGRNQLCKCLFNLAVGVQGGLTFLFEATWVQAVCLNCRMQHFKRAVRDKMPDIWVTSRPSGSYYAKKRKKRKTLQGGILHTSIRGRGISNMSSLLAQVRSAVCGSEHGRAQPSLALWMNVWLRHRHWQRRKKTPI